MQVLVTGYVILTGVNPFPPFVTSARLTHIQHKRSSRVNDEIDTRIAGAVCWYPPE
ncbi:MULTISPECIES: hypothetical protein [unclassified Nostoc]|uniref:hypothetical protein n=1 Tax=unclassified Nostoc TaxID=2593658 RepID=UPI002ADADF5A|nr:hypothetical protein [Nostoc sp. DedQUE02]